ncbi:MAG: histidine triad nucleotide-binding protein [Deltaproteobacteria bacterium]|nr:histidine triad nucleotide-binding protein [Deltaproteobacteria bacterium]MBW1873641.1 histidine triad nucleotide-binding protein [Deltaproteobacteria bacterium]
MSDCIFCKIRDGEIPADFVHQDEICLGFLDINPVAPNHVVLIPREHISTINELETRHEQSIGHIFTVAAKIAKDLEMATSGYRVVVNCNADGGQEVFHIHFHLLGGRRLSWPPG